MLNHSPSASSAVLSKHVRKCPLDDVSPTASSTSLQVQQIVIPARRPHSDGPPCRPASQISAPAAIRQSTSASPRVLGTEEKQPPSARSSTCPCIYYSLPLTIHCRSTLYPVISTIANDRRVRVATTLPLFSLPSVSRIPVTSLTQAAAVQDSGPSYGAPPPETTGPNPARVRPKDVGRRMLLDYRSPLRLRISHPHSFRVLRVTGGSVLPRPFDM